MLYYLTGQSYILSVRFGGRVRLKPREKLNMFKLRKSLKVEQTTILCRARLYILNFQTGFVPFGSGFTLDFIQAICFLSSHFKWKSCLSSQLQFVGENRQCKIVHNGIQKKVFVKSFVWGYFHILFHNTSYTFLNINLSLHSLHL